jgi:hypothetical protein
VDDGGKDTRHVADIAHCKLEPVYLRRLRVSRVQRKYEREKRKQYPRFPNAVQREAVHRRSGTVAEMNNSGFAVRH